MKTIIFLAALCMASVLAQDCKEAPNSKNPDDCCALPMIVPMDIIKECVGKYGEMRKKQLELPGPKRGCCVGDCITDKIGVNPKGDGNLDRDGLKKYLQEHLGVESASWMDTLNAALDKCYKMADDKADEWNKVFAMPPAFDGDKVCHLISGEVLPCITNEMFMNCPSSVYKPAPECDAIKEFVGKCNYVPRQL